MAAMSVICLIQRLPLLQGAASRLAELEYLLLGPSAAAAAAAPAADAPGGGAEGKVRALWVWDLSQDLSVGLDTPALRDRCVWKSMQWRFSGGVAVEEVSDGPHCS